MTSSDAQEEEFGGCPKNKQHKNLCKKELNVTTKQKDNLPKSKFIKKGDEKKSSLPKKELVTKKNVASTRKKKVLETKNERNRERITVKTKKQ